MYNLKTDGVTQGLLQTFLDCPTKALHTIEKWTPVGVAAPMQWGSLAHEVLAQVYDLLRQAHAITVSVSIVEDHVERVCAAHEAEHGSRWTAEETEAFELTVVQLKAVLPMYFQHWHDERMTWRHLEKDFTLPLNVPGVGDVPLRGRIDAAFSYREQSPNKMWLFETKTKSRVDEFQLVSTLTRDFQVCFYLHALQLLAGGTPPVGTLYNIIRRPAHKLKASETMPAYLTRVREEITAEPDHWFKRFEVTTDPHELKDFAGELRETIQEFAAWLKERRPRYYGMPCADKYGLCRFHPICFDNDRSRFVQRDVQFPELVNKEVPCPSSAATPKPRRIVSRKR